MFLKTLKNSDKYFWTEHAKLKMKFYGLSPQRVLRVIRHPERIEEGIVEKTIAVMQPTSTRIKDGKKIWSQEIWAMYQSRQDGKISKFQVTNPNKIPTSKFKNYNLKTSQLKIISTWRYPGISPKSNPIPREILEELESSTVH
jgi:hypothetical protein